MNQTFFWFPFHAIFYYMILNYIQVSIHVEKSVISITDARNLGDFICSRQALRSVVLKGKVRKHKQISDVLLAATKVDVTLYDAFAKHGMNSKVRMYLIYILFFNKG